MDKIAITLVLTKNQKEGTNMKKEQLIKIMICVVLTVAVIIYRKFDYKPENPKTAGEIISSTINTDPVTEEAKDKQSEEPKKDEKNMPTPKKFVEQVVDESNYDPNASDGNIDAENMPYFTNGEVLYKNTDIPISIYENQMECIYNYCNLNFKDPVHAITILEDSVELSKEYLKYVCDLKNDHYLYVTCELKTGKFSFQDGPILD